MPDLLYPAFVAGELSPNIYGRNDKETFYKGLKRARNVYVLPEGGVKKKEGQKYIVNTPSNGLSRGIKFNFNNIQKYYLLFSVGKFQVFKDDVLQATITTSPISALTWDQINEMGFTQKADSLFLAHHDFATIQITRSSDVSWSATNPTFNNLSIYPFNGVVVVSPATGITPSAVSGKHISLTLDSGLFSSAYVGQYLKFANGGLVLLTEYSSTTVMFGAVQVQLVNTSKVDSGNWTVETGYEPVWSVTRGFPGAIRFHQSRLWLGGAKSLPHGAWGSRSGDFFDFDLGTGLDDDGIEIFLDDGQDGEVNSILDMRAGPRNFMFFTTGRNFFIPTEVGKPVTPSSSAGVTSIGPEGIGSAKSVFIDSTVLYPNSAGATIYAAQYDLLKDSIIPQDVSRISSHLIRNPVRSDVRLGTQETPVNYSFWVNSDGTMAVFNLDQQQQLSAWSLFEEAGAAYEDVSVVGTDVYVIVRRVINGSVVRFVEKFDPNYILNGATIQTQTFPETNWIGLSYLNTVMCYARGDDYVLPFVTPSGGAIVTPEIEKLEIGYHASIDVELMPLDSVQIPNFKYTGSWKRIVTATCLLQNTRDFVVTVNGTRFVPSLIYFDDNILDQPPQYFTGWKLIPLSGAGRDATIRFTQDDPLEFCLQAVKVRVK